MGILSNKGIGVFHYDYYVHYHKYYKRNLEECDMEENMEASKVI